MEREAMAMEECCSTSKGLSPPSSSSSSSSPSPPSGKMAEKRGRRGKGDGKQSVGVGKESVGVGVPRYRGVRMRKWGKWVAEIRVPNKRSRIWLGSYASPVAAARAYDTAMFCLRGGAAKLNFPGEIAPGDVDCEPTSPSIRRKAIEVGTRVDAAMLLQGGTAQPREKHGEQPRRMGETAGSKKPDLNLEPSDGEEDDDG